MRRIIKIAFTYVGAVIGAGFVSGQEIFNFFVIHGSEGLALVLITGFLFAILGNSIFLISEKLAVDNYYQLFSYYGGKRLGLLADLNLTLFLLSSFIIMLVGSKEVFSTFIDLKYNWGLILTLLIVIITNFYGLEGVLDLNFILIPILLLIIIVFTLGIDVNLNLSYLKFNLEQLVSTFTYTGYNLVLAITVLLPLVSKFSKLEVMIGISSGGIILGIIAFLIATTLIQFQDQIIGEQLPMLEAVKIYKPQFYYLYALTLWLAMLTTASCNLYALLDRLQLIFKWSREKLLIFVIVLIIPLLQFSFSTLVQGIYPKLGALSLFLFAALVISYIIHRYLLRNEI
ncbi:YkvI family membrane protein [Halanaerobacter jeridensis]|uniref:Membrane protein YkvI n=1 Tax=Halanaerobacter jeridensis TaxID=706427 RepID=A0A939BSX7_9FIRM|nr:hypothetical protein [Halanaerobacter jeridensis]MBM7557616.1 putative membrane protein YkvI [Halanaerobacter jeridensis]